MKRVFSLILVALVTFGVIYFIKYPELLEDIWLWLVGLSGSVVALGRRILDFFKEKLGAVKPLEKVVELCKAISILTRGWIVSQQTIADVSQADHIIFHHGIAIEQ